MLCKNGHNIDPGDLHTALSLRHLPATITAWPYVQAGDIIAAAPRMPKSGWVQIPLDEYGNSRVEAGDVVATNLCTGRLPAYQWCLSSYSTLFYAWRLQV